MSVLLKSPSMTTAAASSAITLQQLQHYLLGKHGLINRSAAFEDHMLPLHATLSTTPYLSLLARVKEFGENDDSKVHCWKKALHEPAQPSAYYLSRCMRGTLHLVPRSMHEVMWTIYGRNQDAGEEEEGEEEKESKGKGKRKKAAKAEDEEEEEVEVKSKKGKRKAKKEEEEAEVVSKKSKGKGKKKVVKEEEGEEEGEEATSSTGSKKQTKKRKQKEESDDEWEAQEEKKSGSAKKEKKKKVEEDEEVAEEEEGESDEKKPFLFRFYRIPMAEVEQLGKIVLQAIVKHGPQNSTSIKKHLPAEMIKKRINGWGSQTSNIGPVLKHLYQSGKLEYGMPPITGKKPTNWRNKQRNYGIATMKANVLDTDAAYTKLGKWYFQLYGPAALEDFAWWMGGSVGQARKTLETIKSELVSVRVEGIDEEMFMYDNHLQQLKKTPNTAPPMSRMLPYEDAIIKAYKATRHRFFASKAFESQIITRGGEARPTIWVDGAIVGVWKWVNKPNQDISISLFSEGKGKSNKHDDYKNKLKEELTVVSKFLESSGVLWE